MAKLAIHGGEKTKKTPYNKPTLYDKDARDSVDQILKAGKIMGPKGTILEFEEAVAQKYGVEYAVMVSSGTAALHTALTALGVEEGDEVITTPMTDIGTVSAILAQHAIPVFADIDIHTRLIDPEEVLKKITPKTKVIIAVHMAGLVCDMERLLKIGREKDIKILEDCAQSHGALLSGRYAGSFGDAAGFSLNESKQISTGDGGLVLTSDSTVADVAGKFRDKTYIRGTNLARGAQPIPFFALNYRPTMVHAALALPQLRKLDELVKRRAAIVARYREALEDFPQLEFPRIQGDSQPSYWPLPLRYLGDDPSRDTLAEAISAEGVNIDTGMSAVSNILRTEMIARKQYYPFAQGPPSFWEDTRYDPDSCPRVDELQQNLLRLPVDQRYTDEDIEETIEAVRKVFTYYLG